MSINEAEWLLAMTGSLRDNVMLSLGYGCGLRAGALRRTMFNTRLPQTRIPRSCHGECPDREHAKFLGHSGSVWVAVGHLDLTQPRSHKWALKEFSKVSKRGCG
jgi:hypothetical protein